MKFKMSFVVPTEDLKGYKFVDLPVKINGVVDGRAIQDIEYSVVIPDYMFNELANSAPKYKTTYDQNNKNVAGCFSAKTLTRKFKKTQTSILAANLQELFDGLTKDITDKHSIETATMNKKLFIKFSHAVSHTTNNWCASYRGQKVDQSFNYFTGYEVHTDAFEGIGKTAKKKYITKIEYHTIHSSTRKKDTGFEEVDDLFLPLTSHNESVEAFENKFSIVDWTQERQDFLEKIKNAFITMNNDLSDFLKDIDSDKIDLLISGGNELKFLE